MIQRLIVSLRALASADPSQLATAAGRQLASDCADAVRLELDCPQQDLTGAERRALADLGALLESIEDSDAQEVVRAARRASLAVGLDR